MPPPAPYPTPLEQIRRFSRSAPVTPLKPEDGIEHLTRQETVTGSCRPPTGFSVDEVHSLSITERPIWLPNLK